jgi:hypothetical protein
MIHSALLTNIRIVVNNFQGTNTLAYFATV